jgi:hypothetical protein
VEAECAAGKLVVVNFFAPECYACKSMQPKLRQIARDNLDAVFLKVNGLVSSSMLQTEKRRQNMTGCRQRASGWRRCCCFAAAELARWCGP